MFTIHIETLGPGVHDLTFTPEAGDLDLDPDTFRDVHVGARLDVSEQRIFVRVRAGASATLECDRTLQRFDQRIEGTYHVLYAHAGFTSGSGEDSGREHSEIRTLKPGDREIDVTDVVRDTILLAVPTRRIAPGAEYVPIPTTFGAPDHEPVTHVDPRWEALRTLV